MKGTDLFTILLLFTIFLLPLYGIYKYGLTGYFNKRLERRQKRSQQIINFFS